MNCPTVAMINRARLLLMYLSEESTATVMSTTEVARTGDIFLAIKAAKLADKEKSCQ